MAEPDDNAKIWKSDETISDWLAGVEARERRYRPHWQLMAYLLPFDLNDVFTVLDLGAGTGAAARTILDRYPRSRAILTDFSPQMMGEAATLLQPYGDRFDYVEFDMAKGDWPAAIPPVVDAVVTSLCMHHLTDDRKRGMFHEIFERVAPGGWYFNFDPISTDDADVEEMWQRATDRLDPESAQKRLHRTPDEQTRFENHVRYIIPLDRQLEFLRAAGFTAIDVYVKQLDYVIYGGKKPPA
jgi:SAM-dependent methyltransferase